MEDPCVANHNQPLIGGLIMTDPDIQKSHHLLKRLDEEMNFLSSLVAQALFISSNLKITWNAIDAIHKNNENKESSEE